MISDDDRYEVEVFARKMTDDDCIARVLTRRAVQEWNGLYPSRYQLFVAIARMWNERDRLAS